MKVFFYGLFMDDDVLAAQGVTASTAVVGFVDGYRLRIGERATLQRHRGARAYGVVMDVPAAELDSLYAQASVADYVPETVTAEFPDGGQSRARCYNLPDDKVAGANVRYAEALLKLATRLGFPAAYLGQIEAAVQAPPIVPDC